MAVSAPVVGAVSEAIAKAVYAAVVEGVLATYVVNVVSPSPLLAVVEKCPPQSSKQGPQQALKQS